ncbi:unnamed protein product [Cylindrotheca closterium]|uniref:J domain-containing protein n=1 Tax=Cylindrotheca closterium TaxID=2856 RepID=A0AAD2JMK3_9STRA|nr:unnamed protein product [Cylindrotheca closterium]
MEIRAKSDHVCRLLKAATEGDIEVLKSASDDELRSSVCNSGCTALHWAAGTNQVTALQYLILERKLSPNILAVKKSKGRTPLHYACRNGAAEATRFLMDDCQANVHALAKHGVSPFQLAVWQNQLGICQYLVEECGVDPCQVNDFDCGAIHWLGICPVNRANNNTTVSSNGEKCTDKDDGSDLLPLAKWLAKQPGLDYTAKQKQGHTALHKASWGGHISLLRYLKEEHGLWDDSVDDAGNYAADLADMANTTRHTRIAKYLREECSRARAESCSILGIDASCSSPSKIRQAYLKKAHELHPDRNGTVLVDDDQNEDDVTDRFDAVRKAYLHLSEHQGHGTQSNPAHSLNLMLQVSGLDDTDTNKDNKDNDDNDDSEEAGTTNDFVISNSEENCFKARLIAVLLEYGDKGLDLSNVKRKWKQVWPKDPFPEPVAAARSHRGRSSKYSTNNQKKKISMKTFLEEQAGDVVELVQDGSGIRVRPKNCSQQKVALHHNAISKNDVASE